MCPGGTVIASASEEGEVVTNGMSEEQLEQLIQTDDWQMIE
jgi:uncharacterized FAD-dependent dehydrogenase